jgi:hypothetical protein
MDIKSLLSKEIEKSSASKKARDSETLSKDTEATELFKPVVTAFNELQNELGDRDDIDIYISDNCADIKLGADIQLKTHRYGFSDTFNIEETRYGYEDVTERRHEFKTSDELITFIVKQLADYIANK